MDVLPEQFPPLPEQPDNDVWSANALEAHSILQNSYNHGLQALRAGDNDAHRLRIHSDRILNRMLPILEALEPEVLNHEWVHAVARTFAALAVGLERATVVMDGVSVACNYIMTGKTDLDIFVTEIQLNL